MNNEFNKLNIAESRYRQLFEDPDEKLITLSHLFDAIREADLQSKVDVVLKKDDPIRVLVEGSAFPRNIDVIENVLHDRRNQDDEMFLVDVSTSSVEQHRAHAMTSNRGLKSEIVQGNMNQLPLPAHSVDILINDCAINFNKTTEDNEQTLVEIKRVLKPEQSVAIVTVVVDRQYDEAEFGVDQELVPDEDINRPGKFQSFKTLDDGSVELIPGTERNAWPVRYYERLFHQHGFNAEKFDVKEGKTFFPIESGISYRRYLLTPST